MWFDVTAALAEIGGGAEHAPEARLPATFATQVLKPRSVSQLSQAPKAATAGRVAVVADVATPSTQSGTPRASAPEAKPQRCSFGGCNSPHAPFGFGWPGFEKDKPANLKGRIYTCADHRTWGKSLMADLDALRAALTRAGAKLP